MADVESNFREVAAALRRLPGLLDLDRPGTGGKRTLGDELSETIAAQIQARTIQGQASPDGGPLPALAPSTKLRKAREGYPGLIGVETGEMLEFEQLRGQVAVSSGEMQMQYGLDSEMKERLANFQAGDPSRNRPPREIYAFDEGTEAAISEHLHDAAEARLRELSD